MKVNIFYIIVVFVLLVVSGCKRNSNKDNLVLPVFDLGAAIGKQVSDTFTWNGIAKKITYIPISTSPNELFGSAKLVYMGRSFYCFVDYKTTTIFRTDINGKVISVISKKGKGPGEYIGLDYVSVNSKDSTIQIFDRRGDKSVVYDLSGNLIQDIALKDKGISVPVLVLENSVIARGRDDSTYKLCITDKNLNIQQCLFPMDTTLNEMERLCLTWQLNFCANRDLSIVNLAEEDTVFTVAEAGVEPLCIFKKGIYSLPEEMAKKPMEFTEQGSPYFRSMKISSIPGYYLISYLFQGHFYDEVWSKTNNQIVSRFVLGNDGVGLPFRLPSGKIIRISTGLFIKDNIVALTIPADVAAEEKLADVKADDNPVLVIMEL